MKKIFTLIFLFSINLLFAQQQLINDKVFSCGTSDENLSPTIIELMQNAKVDVGSKFRQSAENPREVRLAIVVDSTIYNAYQKDTNAIKEILFQSVRKSSLIFEQTFNIRINVTYIEFLSKNRQYGDNNTLRKFQTDYAKSGISRDIMVLWSIHQSEPYGGIASFVGFQQGITTAIHVTSYTNAFPFDVLSHELGHILGSPHTFACGWVTGPFEVYRGIEGNCTRPRFELKFGSLMSYLPLSGTTGLPYFHPLCIDVIQKVSYLALPIMTKAPQISPTPIYPKNGISGFYPTDYFMWTPVEKINGYEVVVSDKLDFTNIILDSLVQDNTFFMSKTLKMGTTYYWRVRAKNQFGNGSWSANFSFKTHETTTLKAPVLNPIDDTRYGEDEILSFKPVNDAKYYIINISDSFEEILTKNSFNAGDYAISYFRAGNYAASSFDWRVKAVSGSLSSDWSAWQNVGFSQKVAPLDNISTLSTNFPLIYFDNLSPYALDRKYFLDISETSDFKTLTRTKRLTANLSGGYGLQGFRGFTTTIIADSLEPNKRYYARYKLKTAVDSTNWLTTTFSTSYEQRWKTNAYSNSVLPFEANLQSVFIDNQNNRWAYGLGGIYMISADGKTQKKFTAENTNNVVTNYVFVVKQDASTNRLWFGTFDGILTYDNGVWQRFSAPLWSSDYNDSNITDLVVSKKAIYFVTTSRKIFQYDGKTWTNITQGKNFIPFAFRLRIDSQDNLWGVSLRNANSEMAIFDGQKWTTYSPQWHFLKNNEVNPTLDNLGNIYFSKGDSLFMIKENDGKYQAQYNIVSIIDSQTGRNDDYSLKADLLIPFDIIKNGNRTYYFSIAGDGTVLETDGNRWWLHHFLEQKITQLSISPAIPHPTAVDNNGKMVFLQAANTLMEFDPKDVIANFNQKTISPTCDPTIKFQIGIASPPTSTIEQNNLKVFLSDSSSTTFKQVAATYQNGEVIFAIPKTLKGKGYRFKFTIGDNWLESKESTAFDISDVGSIDISGNTSFCAGGSTTLTGLLYGSSPYTYQWKKGSSNVGSNSNKLTITQLGDYTLTATDAKGCSFKSNTINITETKLTAQILGETSYCAGTSTTLSSKVDGKAPFVYQWKKGSDNIGANSDKLTVTQAGDYSLSGTDATGCTIASNTTKVTEKGVLATISPNGSTIAYQPNTVKLTAPTANNTTYQWQKDGKDIANATASSFEAKETGSYTVILKKDGCVSTSAATNVSIQIALANSTPTNLNLLEIFAYPNPTQDKAIVNVSSKYFEPIELQLVDVSGNLLQSLIVDEKQNQYKVEFNLSKYPTGIYLINAQNAHKKLSIKILKN